MDERDAILEAVYAHPEEDTPRLAYADWLDEHGEGVHAEFIRVQIELERHKERSAARTALKKREVAAWRRYQRWLAGWFPGMKFYKSTFQRGFHEGTTGWRALFPVVDFLAHSDCWWPWLPVRWMRFSSWDQFPDELLESSHLRRLTRISFYLADSRDSIREEFVARLFSSTRFDRLTGLDVSNVPLSRPVVDAIRGSPFLHQLGQLHVNYGASGRSGWLRYPEDIPPHDQYRFGEPGGAPDAIGQQLDELSDNLLEVPPGATTWEALLDMTTRRPMARFRRE